MALKWPIMCWCAVKKLLTHSLTHSLTENAQISSKCCIFKFRNSDSIRQSGPNLVARWDPRCFPRHISQFLNFGLSPVPVPHYLPGANSLHGRRPSVYAYMSIFCPWGRTPKFYHIFRVISVKKWKSAHNTSKLQMNFNILIWRLHHWDNDGSRLLTGNTQQIVV